MNKNIGMEITVNTQDFIAALEKMMKVTENMASRQKLENIVVEVDSRARNLTFSVSNSKEFAKTPICANINIAGDENSFFVTLNLY